VWYLLSEGNLKMQFIKNGPDIPERLLQSHEEGRVVFFSGAGISYPAGLPGFEGLVYQLYHELGITPNDVQKTAIDNKEYDRAITLLEVYVVGGRETVRKSLLKVLSPNFSLPNATLTHEALLILSKNRKGQTRHITTNIDPIFREITSYNKGVTPYVAPLLPIPKSSWNGLIYLHGLLPKEPEINSLNELVISSGDFGRAYLNEGWAARFVSELFRNYTVCFVGYSISDPILRYMMDALAADSQMGETLPEMFAFASYSKGNEKAIINEWQAKNVTPILYLEDESHICLHGTIQRWSETYRDGSLGKERIVADSAMLKPMASTRQDNYVDRMLWALNDPTGLPAKHFADLDPVPTLDWLEPLCEERYLTDLKNTKTSYSQIRRKISMEPEAWMSLVSFSTTSCQLDNRMFHLARWLTRHLDDPRLVIWIAKCGGQLHETFAKLIKEQLKKIEILKQATNNEELTRLQDNAPNMIPRPAMSTLWCLILGGFLKSPDRNFKFYDWLERFKFSGLTTPLRLELREILAPRVVLRETYKKDLDMLDESLQVRDLVSWDIELNSSNIYSFLQPYTNNSDWIEALPRLLPDITLLLRDTLDLMRVMGDADDHHDFSYIHQPSISDHFQNKEFYEWTALIKMAKEAWIVTAQYNPQNARLVAEDWFQTPYPLFKRLAFFTAAHPNNVISINQALDWLLSDNCRWLWSDKTKRESIRLLVDIAPKLEPNTLATLEDAIMIGPPRDIYLKDIENERWIQIMDREIWLRLLKIETAGAKLGKNTKAKLDSLAIQHPEWQFADDDREEFSHWMSDGNEWIKSLDVPLSRRKMVAWLKQHPHVSHWEEDNWRQRCHDNFNTTVCALFALSQEDIWPIDRWRTALRTWATKGFLNRSWRYMAPVLNNASNEIIQTLTNEISWWLHEIARTFEHHEAIFFSFCKKILAIKFQICSDADEDVVAKSLNQPIGHVTEALLRWWYRRELEDAQTLPEEIKTIFTELCNINIDKYRYGRIFLAANVVNLFRVDFEWTHTHLLPLFDWQNSQIEAQSAWEGFLWSPRLYWPLLSTIKASFLNTATHYQSLGKHKEQYAALLTFAGLELNESFSIIELRKATRSLPISGIRASAQALVRALEGAGDQRSNYWANRVLPYLQTIWPKSHEYRTSEISEALALLCIVAQEEFTAAFNFLQHWLQPIEHLNYILNKLDKLNLCSLYPETALAFLDLVINENKQWLPLNLKKCLKDIETVEPKHSSDVRFKRLNEFAQLYEKS